jgi:phage-related protein (TIGR01555 family)
MRMGKKLATRSRAIVKSAVKNQLNDGIVKNGLGEAIFGNLFEGFGPGSLGNTLNEVGTLFKNNRNYFISNLRQLLSEIYCEHGVIQTVIDVPVDDALRGGVDIKSKQLDPDQIQIIQQDMERRDILNTSIGQAGKWNRLFGGAGILFITDQDPTTPFDVYSLKEDSLIDFRAVDMWELFQDKQNTEGFNASLPLQPYEDVGSYTYYGRKFDPSRVLKMKGLTAPSFLRPRLRGWGLSVIEAIVNSVNQYLKSNSLTFEVLDEFKIDYYKIKGLSQTLLSPQGSAKVHKRIEMMNAQKNYQNAVSMDADDDYIQKQLTFAGISEAMEGIRMQLASDLRMPLTKIFGISAAGFSSGEDDIENYNAMIESQVRAKMKFEIIKIIEILSQMNFGFVPDDISIEFKPLRILSAEQQENVKTQQYARLTQAVQIGMISQEQFIDACNKDNLLGIQIDSDEMVPAPEKETPNGKQGGDANEEDSEKSEVPKVIGLKSVTQPKEAKEAAV